MHGLLLGIGKAGIAIEEHVGEGACSASRQEPDVRLAGGGPPGTAVSTLSTLLRRETQQPIEVLVYGKSFVRMQYNGTVHSKIV